MKPWQIVRVRRWSWKRWATMLRLSWHSLVRFHCAITVIDGGDVTYRCDGCEKERMKR